MATAVSTVPPSVMDGRQPSQWARNYPPLIALAIALIIAVIVLPSSLNVPQSHPSTTLEFAPVPPDKDKPPPPVGGNLSNLGLGSSSGLTSGGLPGGNQGGPGSIDAPPPAGALVGVGKSPRTKNCVGNPPRQTEDKLSPPCVADFQGDNFGETYQGVTREEIRILFYIQGHASYVNLCKDPNQTTPDGNYYDLAAPPEPGEFCVLRALRVYQQYFNDRFQTYGRFAHFFVYFSGTGSSAEERKADAADNYNRVKPFAVVSTAGTFNDAYLDSMSKRGVLAFDQTPFRDETFFTKYPGRTWGYAPSQQFIAKMFADMLCTQVVAQNVSWTGNATDAGKPRKYGIVYTTDAGHPELQSYKTLMLAAVKGQCGLDLSAAPSIATPTSGWAQDNRYPPSYAARGATDFQSKGVTTVIWVAGLETQISKAADDIGYQPEIIVTGDGIVEGIANSGFQGQGFWNHAVVMTNLTSVPDQTKQPCFIAFRETDPNADDGEARAVGCTVYDSIRQLFTGVQVAGPRLTPSAMDKGYHAIPHVPSNDPQTPACFYEQGDYTCIKDAMMEHWDRTATNGYAGAQGCYRMAQGGLRHPTGDFPTGNLSDRFRTDDPCNSYGTNYNLNPNPPSTNNPVP